MGFLSRHVIFSNDSSRVVVKKEQYRHGYTTVITNLFKKMHLFYLKILRLQKLSCVSALGLDATRQILGGDKKSFYWSVIYQHNVLFLKLLNV